MHKQKQGGTLMAQLWGGRFTKETDQLVYNFNASISFDQKSDYQVVRHGLKKQLKLLGCLHKTGSQIQSI